MRCYTWIALKPARYVVLFLPVISCLVAWLTNAAIAETRVPNFWDNRERLETPKIQEFERIRFLTTIDFPPFNYLGADGRLTGFHIDLARAICKALDVTKRCQIQALPWDELEGALLRGEGEAIIAGLAVTGQNRRKLAFTRPYLKFPARFVMPAELAVDEPIHEHIAGRRVGVLARSMQAKMLRDYFPQAKVVTYDSAQWMLSDIKGGKLAAVFGDGMQLAFWLGSASSGNCCQFAGGPYLSDSYLGHGLAIATVQEQSALVDAFDYALREIHASGRYGEIYLRYFPTGFY